MLGTKYRPYLRYAVFRWIMPHLGHDPLFHMNLAQKAWPKVAGLTANRKYTDQIESIDCGSHGSSASDVLVDYARTSRPVVLKGYIGRDVWTLEKVKNEVGDIVQTVRVGNYDEAAGNPDVIRMTVADFIDYLQGRSEFPYKDRLVKDKGPYLGNVQFPSLAKQIPLPSFFPTTPEFSGFWLGSWARSPLHCHQHCDVLLTQLVGRRSVILVPPHQAGLVGCVPRNYNACTAEFDPFEPDQQRFPADLIHSLRYELEGGDTLLIPGFWFHAVRLTQPSFAVSQFNDGVMPLAVGGGPRGPWQKRAYMQGWG